MTPPDAWLLGSVPGVWVGVGDDRYRPWATTKGARRVRVYLPATTTILRTLVDEAGLPGPLTGFAVTQDLRRFYSRSDADADTEELEYAALVAAARASLRLLDLDPFAARRRVVVSAEVPDEAVTAVDDPDADAGAVRVAADVPLAQVASAHIDDAEAEEDVRAAVNVVLEADLGSADAEFTVDQAEGHELAWYATQEIGPALELF
jgi:hypothetical protein